jgi:NAD(P)-dependent dehydrogenase (short-subunit alcohol dehydrogenase family)
VAESGTGGRTGLMGGMPFAGRSAAVTGAGRGIGAAICDTLARLGASVVLLGRHGDTLAAQAEALRNRHGATAMPIACDVTDAKSVAAALARAGSVSILVNNAGAAKSAPFHRTGDELWHEMLDVNLWGAINCTRAFLPAMLEAGHGRIVNIASTAGITGFAYVTAYCAAKHALVGLTRSLALETAKKGVTVNAVCPGYTDTDIVRETVANIVSKTGRSEANARAELAAHNPQGRIIAPVEIAETVAFLSLDSSASITGQSIAVAGGELM